VAWSRWGTACHAGGIGWAEFTKPNVQQAHEWWWARWNGVQGRLSPSDARWMRNRNTIEFLGLWEQLNNPDFNSIELDGFRKQAGLNSFILTPKLWIEKTAAIGGCLEKPP
jgi:hypothetical protein